MKGVIGEDRRVLRMSGADGGAGSVRDCMVSFTLVSNLSVESRWKDELTLHDGTKEHRIGIVSMVSRG